MKPIPVRRIKSQPLQKSAGQFSIRSLQEVLKGKNLVHDLHKHDFYFVLALEKGKGIHEIDFIPYKVHNHSIFLLRPGQVHRLELSADSKGFLIEFDLRFYQPRHSITEQRWKKATAKNYCDVEKKCFIKLNTFLSNMHDEFVAMQDGYTEAVKANLDLFFLAYIRQSHHAERIAKPESSYIQERFEEFAQMLETNIGSMKTVSQYAAKMNVSAYQLNAITKTSVGKNVSELINEQIILEARRYLLATSSQVKDIADYLGYEDVSYFIRFFRKHTGLSPEAYRKNFT